MNSLQMISDKAKRAMIALTILSFLAISANAQMTDPRTQGQRYGDAGFTGEVISLQVVNADIRDILNHITQQYGINFVIDKSVQAVPVTVNVNEVPWDVALDSILRSQELGVQVNGTILRIAESKTLAAEGEIFRQQQNNKLDTSPLLTEFVRLNYARAKDGMVRGTATSGTSVNISGNMGGTPYNETRTIGPTFESGTASGSSEGILNIIRRRLSRRGSIEVDGRSNSLIITDVRENIDAIKQLVAILDQPEPQVEIEARIVVATRSFSRDIGVQLAGIVTGSRGALGQGGTLPVPQTTGGGEPQTGGIMTQPNNDLKSIIPNTVIGLTTGIFGTAQLSALISAGEQQGEAKIIATPRVTALNNRSAIIESKTQIPVVTIQPGAAGAGGVALATTEYVDVPLKLEITPQITDVGTIVLEVLAENSSTATIVAGAPPAINTQKMQSQITVPDGGTTVVGGVLFDDEREGQDRTPGLSRIPLLGYLFKRKSVRRDTNEILFFITPRIHRPNFPDVSGTSGTRPSATIVQPVPMGNPASNSDPVQVLPSNLGQPAVQMPTNAPVPVLQPGGQNGQPQRP